jgi:hypothetical protein
LEATRLLRQAAVRIRGEKDPVMLWEYLRREAATFINLRRAGDARQALDRAIGIAGAMQDGHRLAEVLMQRAHLDQTTGSVDAETLLLLKRAARLADPFREPWLPGAISLNLAVGQADLGLHDEAMATWSQVEEFKSPIQEFKRRGVLGYLHLAAERWEPACTELMQTAEGLISAEVAEGVYYQILSALALLGAGRFNESNRVSLEATAYLSSTEHSAIAVAAKNVADQARQRMITKAALNRLKKAIEESGDGSQRQVIINPSA